jgi:hypothetical protein
MYKPLNSKILLFPVLIFFIFYLFWLFRAYHDVPYMDQMNILAGNINHMYNHDATLNDYYYRSPFLFVISTLLVFLNCKLFSYNTFYENITTAIILLLIALYFIKSTIAFFDVYKYKFYFTLFASLIIFCFAKWGMSLWGGGFSHYMVVLFGFICVNIAHTYYSNLGQNNRFSYKYFLPIYIGLSLLSIFETTAYFLPFQLSLLILLLVNFKLFKDKIDLRKWKVVLITTIGLIIFSLLINSLAESYAAHHHYDTYGKVNTSQSLGDSFKKMVNEPGFVVKFFLIANAGSLIDEDAYKPSDFGQRSMPWFGLIILAFSLYAMYLFIKRKKIEGLFSINLILCSILFNVMVLIGRLSFNDVYYGASSRYSAETFSGLLGIGTFFLLLKNKLKNGNTTFKKAICLFPIGLIVICSLIIDRNQWRIAPYRKKNFLQWTINLKENKNLKSLQANNVETIEKARETMIRNKLNIFKPKMKLTNYTLECTRLGPDTTGFYSLGHDSFGAFRWTDGNGIVLLPNLYAVKDTIHLKLICYSPQADTPRVTLNDNLKPFDIGHFDRGYNYSFAFQDPKVLFKVSIQNKSIIPHDLNKDNPDKRKLGLIFRSITLYE